MNIEMLTRVRKHFTRLALSIADSRRRIFNISCLVIADTQ